MNIGMVCQKPCLRTKRTKLPLGIIIYQNENNNRFEEAGKLLGHRRAKPLFRTLE